MIIKLWENETDEGFQHNDWNSSVLNWNYELDYGEKKCWV